MALDPRTVLTSLRRALVPASVAVVLLGVPAVAQDAPPTPASEADEFTTTTIAAPSASARAGSAPTSTRPQLPTTSTTTTAPEPPATTTTSPAPPPPAPPPAAPAEPAVVTVTAPGVAGQPLDVEVRGDDVAAPTVVVSALAGTASGNEVHIRPTVGGPAVLNMLIDPEAANVVPVVGLDVPTVVPLRVVVTEPDPTA